MPDDNPYAGRNHEVAPPSGSADLHSIAALVGNVSGQLKDIDSKIVGSHNPHTQALKIDPMQAVKSIVGPTGATPPPRAPSPGAIPQSVTTQPAEMIPVPQSTSAPPPEPSLMDPSMDVSDLERRIAKLERDVCNYNKSFKFKRGISYNLSTSSIKGSFKNPDDIIDVVLSELAKNAKTITIKLEDANKIRK